MPRRRRTEDPKQQPQRQRALRSPKDVYEYWTEEMMSEAQPVELERRPKAGARREKDDGERGGG